MGADFTADDRNLGCSVLSNKENKTLICVRAHSTRSKSEDLFTTDFAQLGMMAEPRNMQTNNK